MYSCLFNSILMGCVLMWFQVLAAACLEWSATRLGNIRFGFFEGFEVMAW